VIDHEYGSLTGEGPCECMVLFEAGAGLFWATTTDGELIAVTDDRSIYKYCARPKEEHDPDAS